MAPTEIHGGVSHELRVEPDNLHIIVDGYSLIRAVKPRKIVLLQPAWQKQVTVDRNALVAPAVRPADEKTGGRDNIREHLVDRLPEHLERWQVHVGDRRWLGGIVANDVDLDFRVVNPVPDVIKRLVDALARQDADIENGAPFLGQNIGFETGLENSRCKGRSDLRVRRRAGLQP